MKIVINDEKYGEITYEESFWSGKKSLSVNGTPLAKVAKTQFNYVDGEEKKAFIVQGNYLKGAKLIIDGRTTQLYPPVKWYEIVLSVIGFVLVLVWGNSVTLCEILPVVGGAIGGIISALFAICNLFIIKKSQANLA